MSDWNRKIIEEFRANAGNVASFGGATLVILHTVGARTGKESESPVRYFPEDGGSMVVVASAAGAPKNPAWYHNLKANPDTVIHLRGERGRNVHAREATGDEYDHLWSQLLGVYADFAKYKKWTDRHIPVMVLEPR